MIHSKLIDEFSATCVFHVCSIFLAEMLRREEALKTERIRIFQLNFIANSSYARVLEWAEKTCTRRKLDKQAD